MHPTALQPLDATREVHARIDFLDRGHQYLAGEPYPVDGLDAVKLQRLIDARYIVVGAPPATLAARAKERRAELDRAARASAPLSPTTKGSAPAQKRG